MRLFASQGYEATTTLQVAKAVGITEPSVFYHFKNKIALYTAILQAASTNYLQRLDTLNNGDQSAFGALEALIQVHIALVEQEPEYTSILMRSCPSRLRDTESACVAIFQTIQAKLKDATTAILEKGVALNEFRPVDIEATANTLIAMLQGLMMQQLAAPGKTVAVEAAAVDFCKSALMSPIGIQKSRRKTKTARAL